MGPSGIRAADLAPRGRRATCYILCTSALVLATLLTGHAHGASRAVFDCNARGNFPLCKVRTSSSHPLRCKVAIQYEFKLRRRSPMQRRVHKGVVDIPEYGQTVAWSWRGKRPQWFRVLRTSSSCQEKGIVGNRSRRV